MSKPIVVLFGKKKIIIRTVCDIESGGESFDSLETLASRLTSEIITHSFAGAGSGGESFD